MKISAKITLGESVQEIKASSFEELIGKITEMEKSLPEPEAEAPTQKEAMIDPKDKAAAHKLLKSLGDIFKEDVGVTAAPRSRSFRGEKITEYPVAVDVKGYEGIGNIVEVPVDLMKEPFEGDPEKELSADPGEKVAAPEGHAVYAWSVKVRLSPEEVGKAENVAKEVSADLAGNIKKMGGQVKAYTSVMDVDQDDNPTAISSGVFTAPAGQGPEGFKKVADEAFGIRSMLPKEVAQ
jgi:hypothetical protein